MLFIHVNKNGKSGLLHKEKPKYSLLFSFFLTFFYSFKTHFYSYFVVIFSMELVTVLSTEASTTTLEVKTMF